MRGNTSDKTTLAGMLEKITARYGKERRIWIMDRGIPTEEDLGKMRRADPSVRIKESFRTLKDDLGMRPVFHQLDGRIEARVFISFLAYCLHVTLGQYNKKAATGLSSPSVLERLSEIQMLDVTIPATDGRELRMKRHTKPEKGPPAARPTRPPGKTGFIQRATLSGQGSLP